MSTLLVCPIALTGGAPETADRSWRCDAGTSSTGSTIDGIQELPAAAIRRIAEERFDEMTPEQAAVALKELRAIVAPYSKTQKT